MAKATITIVFTDDGTQKGLVHNCITMEAEPAIDMDVRKASPAQITALQLMQVFADNLESGEDEDE